MSPRTTDLGEIITYDRVGDYYLKEIILRRARSLAPFQPSFKCAAKQSFLSRPFTFVCVAVNVHKEKSDTDMHPQKAKQTFYIDIPRAIQREVLTKERKNRTILI